MPESLSKEIHESCSSVESLRAEFLATANAMFGPGFVWLVKSRDGNLRILSTYIAGSPYPAAHFRRQPVDMATETTGIAGGENADAISRLRATNKVGSMGQYSGAKVLPPGGIDVQPILCVNTWEHVYLRDWGVGGKGAFLEAWWDKINWEEVAQNYKLAGGRDSVHSSSRGSRPNYEKLFS
jgi:Fe-Mn family superoxide dismutase